MKILVINGPNLNMLGRRDAAHYGADTLADVEDRLRARAEEIDVDVDFFQSNHEGAIVDHLQASAGSTDGVIINAGALTHYGLSLKDALADSGLPIAEVHISNIHAREEYRHHSVVAPIAVGQVAGFGWRGYLYALDFLAAHIGEARAE